MATPGARNAPRLCPAEPVKLSRMLPAGSYRLSDEAVTIAEGTNVSTPSSFEIVSMDDFDEGANYCVPLKITGTSNGMGVLEASRTQYIFISQITTTRGINLKNSWYITMDGMVDDPALKDLPACTMEIRMYANGWRTSGHMISSLIGVEENFLLRVGDESIKNPAQLQLAGRGTSITAPNALSLGRWYHIAVVDNGSEMTIYIDGNAEISVDSSSSKAINLGFYYNSPFAIGMSAHAVGQYKQGRIAGIAVPHAVLIVLPAALAAQLEYIEFHERPADWNRRDRALGLRVDSEEDDSPKTLSRGPLILVDSGPS